MSGVVSINEQQDLTADWVEGRLLVLVDGYHRILLDRRSALELASVLTNEMAKKIIAEEVRK